MKDIVRLDERVILALHDQQIEKFGGEYGVLDEMYVKNFLISHTA